MGSNVSVLILSCDKYEDLWYPFFILFYRYWNCPYKVYISTETKNCEYAQAINISEPIWTNRIRKSLESIDTKYVIILCDDFFLRSKVDQKRIDYCLSQFNDSIATFNFEKSYDNKDVEYNLQGFKLRPNGSLFLRSCQAGIWNRKKLIELFKCSKNPWQWEMQIIRSPYKFYINSGDFIFNYGYENRKWFGVCKGKWVIDDVKPLFEKENIKIDFNIRGVI